MTKIEELVYEVRESAATPHCDVIALVKCLYSVTHEEFVDLCTEAADVLEVQAARVKELEEQLYGIKGEVSTTGVIQEAVEFLRSWRNAEERVSALEAERDSLLAKLEKTKEAIEKWQEWWELPWEAKRPDIASLIHKRTLAILAELSSKEKT